ncbi:unnamed protein product [Adineta steineri]|uniref:Uncharacterized protein n=1 Tax=Adineta steineri TaxID=433720 RepID=A0A818Y656_9BILA|nr:unnamed protein product [Adineta steineri]CAF3745777.1 unnamed protein product [Adineta steineri]
MSTKETKSSDLLSSVSSNNAINLNTTIHGDDQDIYYEPEHNEMHSFEQDTTQESDSVNGMATELHQSRGQELKQEESENSDDTDSMTTETGIGTLPYSGISRKNAILISGLPSTMTEQLLFDTLWGEFRTIGRIKIDKQTKKPSIHLYKNKKNKDQLSGNAKITFEKEEAVAEAIKKYNKICVQTLKNARIGVEQSEIKAEALRQRKSQILLKPVVPSSSARDKQRRGTSSPKNLKLTESSHFNKDNVHENLQIFKKDTIFIRGLPLEMTEQHLFDTLLNEFSTVGQIKKNEKTHRPYIDLFKAGKNKTRLAGSAKITFEQEESTIKAIEEYNASSSIISATDIMSSKTNTDIYNNKIGRNTPYHVNIINLSKTFNGKKLCEIFRCSVENILLNLDEKECWILGFDQKRSADQFASHWNNKQMTESRLEYKSIMQQQLTLCESFRTGNCVNSNCEFRHKSCTIVRCSLYCPYGHQPGMKDKNVQINAIDLRPVYRIRINGITRDIDSNRLPQLLKLPVQSKFLFNTDDSVSIINISSLKYAQQTVSRVHHQEIASGVVLSCQLELENQISPENIGSEPVVNTISYNQFQSKLIGASVPNNLNQSPGTSYTSERGRTPIKTELFEKSVDDLREQARDLPLDLPPEWISRNQRSGEPGGQGEVRIIYHKNNSKYVAAIKVYGVQQMNKKRKDEYFKERRMRAHRELTALKELKDIKNVSKLTSYTRDYTNLPENQEDAVRDTKVFWIIMDFISGCTLEQFMEDYFPEGLDLINAIKLTQQLLTTIEQVHSTGIVHRDIKPGNLLVVYDKQTPIESAQIHVVDFGLAFIDNFDDIPDWSIFEKKEPYDATHLDTHLGNHFYISPQMCQKSLRGLSDKEKNELMILRRSETVDASSICAILFWLITSIEPHRYRNEDEFAPHEENDAVTKIAEKIDETVANITKKNHQISSDFLKEQLKCYLMSTFDKGFEVAEYQWSIQRLKYRLELFRQIVEPDLVSLDEELQDASENLLHFNAPSSSNNFPLDKLRNKDIFHKVSIAFTLAKNKFIEKRSDLYSWADGNCQWLEYRQNMKKRKNYDVLSFHCKNQNWILMIICSVYFNEKGDTITLSVGTNTGGLYNEVPIGIFTPELNSLNIDSEFEIELIHLLYTVRHLRGRTNMKLQLKPT